VRCASSKKDRGIRPARTSAGGAARGFALPALLFVPSLAIGSAESQASIDGYHLILRVVTSDRPSRDLVSIYILKRWAHKGARRSGIAPFRASDPAGGRGIGANKSA